MSDYANFNPVPDGVGGHGSSVLFGDGLGALRYLERADKQQAAIKARAQAAAQKQVDASQKQMLAIASKINPSTGVVYGPMQQQGAQEDYQKLEDIATNLKLSPAQRNFQMQQVVDARNRNGEAGKANDKFINGEIQNALTDKRLDATIVAKKLHDTVYRKNDDGSLQLDANDKPQVIPPLEYNIQATAAALAQGNDHINTPKLFENFVDTLPDDSVAYARQPLPGGQGFRRLFKSNVFESNDDGTPKLDPKTSKRILKNSPEMLRAFRSDPLQEQWLTAEEAKHEQQLAGVIEKMKNNQPLSEDEQRVVATEQSVDGRKMELVKRGLFQYGYGRQETDLLAKAAPRPLASRAPKAPTNVVNLPTDSLPGAVLGGTGVNGTSGIVSYGLMPALSYGKPGQEAKKYSAHGVKHQEVVTQRDNGSPAEVTTANQAKMDVEYGARHILLRGENGTVFFPPKAAVEAAKRGDFGPSEEFARQTRATHPGTKPEWYVEATPLSKGTPQPGAKLKYYDQLKAAQQADGSLTTAQQLTDKQLHEKADREFGKQNATHYVRYRGQDKISIDQAYGYALRNTKAGKAAAQAMDDALADADKRTRPQAGTPRAATSAGSFYTPKLPKAPKAAATGATPNNFSKPAPRDPYAL